MAEPTRSLRTKLRLPRPRPGMVPRPRPHEPLDRGTAAGVTLVSAPAGFTSGLNTVFLA